MTVGASPSPLEARISPRASGWPSQSRSSASPPAERMKSHTHSPARRTSSARSASALTLGMRMNSASSSSQACSTGGQSRHGTAGRDPLAAGCRSPQPLGRDVLENLRLRECAELLQALVLDLTNPLARDIERPPHLVQRPRVLAVEAVAELQHT